MTDRGDAPSKTQQWFRDLSEHLQLSFRSSARIAHGVTKGESREQQILDVFRQLLPTRISLQQNVVIIDSEDAESPKFDAVLFDRTLWPLLWQQDTTMTAMLESVLAAIEIKSSLDLKETRDIFSKTALLRRMHCEGNAAFICPPLVTAFAYQCTNINLAFFDFTAGSYKAPELSPSLFCILNQALFGLTKEDVGALVPVAIPNSQSIPVLYEPKEDTLLMYLYFLSQWVSLHDATIDVFTRYSNRVFSNLTAFHFDADFLETIASDATALKQARGHFTRRPTRNIRYSYRLAREGLGLSE